MKWTKKDVETFLKTKEYIDTLLIPLVKIDLTKETQMIESALEREYVDILAIELERRLAGRLMLLPTYNYVHISTYETEIERLDQWIQSFKEQSFEHIFLLSLDHEWTKYSQQLNSQFLWLSHVPFDNMSKDDAKGFVQTQADKLSRTIQSFWS